MKKIFPLIWLLFICQEAPVLAVTQITDSLYVKQGAEITRLYTDSAALRTMTLSGSSIGTPGDSCMFLNLGVPVHCTKAQVLAWLGSSGITSINTGTAAAHTIVGEQGLQVLDSGTNLYKHVIVPATGYIIPTGSNMRVDSTTLADSAADAGKWGGNVYGGPYLGLHATADTSIAADRARKLATTRTIGKSTTFDGTANIVPDSAVSVVQATQLTTARTIGNTSFNGTANIIPDTCNKANRARYADSSGATHKADTSISSHQSAQLTTAVNIGNVSFNGTAAIIPDTANKANRARYSDSTGKIPDTVHIRLGLSANNINVSNVQTTNLNGTAIGSAYSVVGADQSGAGTAAANAAVSGTSGDFAKFTGAHTVGNSSFMSENGTGVGIGTDAPAGQLQVYNSGDNNVYLTGGTSNWATLNFGNSTTNNKGAVAYSNSDNHMELVVNSTIAEMILSNGNVGIGTDAPAGQLQVYNSGDNNVYLTGGTSNWATLNFGNSTTNNKGAVAYSNSDNHMELVVNSTIAEMILSNGNVGIGTTSPGNQLAVINSTSTFPNPLVAFELTNAGATNGLLYLFHSGTGHILDLVRGYLSSPASGDWIHWNDASYGPSSGGIKAGGSWAWDTQLYGDQGLSLSGNGYSAASPSMVITTGSKVGIGTTSPDSQLTVSAGAHIGGGLLVGGAATIENNIVLGDYGGIPGFYMKSDNLSIGSQTGGLYGQITSNGWSIQSEITAPSMNVSGNDTVGGTIFQTGSNINYFNSPILCNQGIRADTFTTNVSQSGLISYSSFSTTSTNINLAATSYPVYVLNMTGALSTVTLTFSNVPSSTTNSYSITVINNSTHNANSFVYSNPLYGGNTVIIPVGGSYTFHSYNGTMF